jgi:ABC-type transporter Mla subunit MlaD
MGDEGTNVDVLSLDDFQTTLAARLTEANGLLTKLNTTLQGAPPQLGGFQDAVNTAGRYSDLHGEHTAGVQRLIDAITAAQTATATIMNNYNTTEARNAANASDIANTLSPVGEVLNGGQANAG